MFKYRTALLVVMLAAGGLVWWKTHGTKTPAEKAAEAVKAQQLNGSAGATSATRATPSDPNALVRVSIAVTDDKGSVAGAQLRLEPTKDSGDDGLRDAREVVVNTTRPDGKTLVDLAPGAWTFSASAPGHEPGFAEATLVAGDSPVVSIVLVAGGKQLTGTVTDASGGPVAGVRVDASKVATDQKPSRAVAMALTGADGKYALSVPAGQLLVAASHADYAPQARYVDLVESAVADFSLVPGGVIEGIVLDEKSRAPVAARVISIRDGGNMLMAESGVRAIAAGADGKFRFAGLRPGAYELTARATSGASAKNAVRVGLGVAEQLGDVEILVGAMPSITGKVVDDKNAPVADVGVSAQAGMRDVVGARSGKDGTFALTGVAPGKWTVMATGDAWLPAGMSSVDVADKDVAGVIVRVHPAVKLVGHVEPRQVCDVRVDLDADDGPRGGPMPMMMVAPVRSAADGTFALAPLAPGKLTIVARCEGGDQGSLAIAVAPGGPEVVVAVKPGASIAGKVSDGAGKPVAGATVMATPTGASEHLVIVNGRFASGVQAMTRADGSYELRGLAAGEYRMAVLDRGKPMKSSSTANEKVTLAATDKKTGVDLVVELPNGKITGVVTGADDKPLADAWVSLHQDLAAMIESMGGGKPGEPPPGTKDGESSSRTMTIEANDEDDTTGQGNAPVLTGPDGKFEFTRLAAGAYEVVAEAQKGKLRGRANNVRPDAAITIAAVGLSTLSGHVKGATGVYTITLDGPTATSRSFAAADGAFEIGRVDPGDYRITVASSAGNGAATLTVKPNTPATIDIALVANAVVIGKVTDAAGAPAAGIGVALIDDTGDGKMQIRLEGPPPTTNPDGTFRVESPAGKKMLVLLSPGIPKSKPGLVLEAGKTLDAGTIKLDK